MTIQEIRPIVETEIKKHLETATRKYGKQFPYPTISFQLRGAIAGSWSQNQKLLKLNLTLMTQNFQEYIDRTIPHEVAHLITFALFNPYKVKPHGYEWKNVMYDLGVQNVSRTHSYDTVYSRVVPRPYIYCCHCQEHPLTALLHGRIQKGDERKCKSCHTTLVLKSP